MRFFKELFARKVQSLQEFVILAREGVSSKVSVRLMLDLSGTVLTDSACASFSLEHLAETSKGRWVVYREPVFSREGIGMGNRPRSEDLFLFADAGKERRRYLEVEVPGCIAALFLQDGRRAA